jgi:hypothetical protein
MKRFMVSLVTAVLALSCYHDNASPFVHGGGNKPPAWGSTWASASGSRSNNTGAGSYSASSGYAGGYEKEPGNTVPSTTAATSPNAMTAPSAPSMPAAATSTAAPHAASAKTQTKPH